MRVIRTVILSILFIVGVFLASANVHDVDLVFLPNLPVAGWPAIRSVSLPLFVLVLGALVLGVMLGGFGALFEQARLRRGLRRTSKEKDKLAGELGALRAEFEQVQSELEESRGEIERVRSELAQAKATVVAGDGESASQGRTVARMAGEGAGGEHG